MAINECWCNKMSVCRAHNLLIRLFAYFFQCLCFLNAFASANECNVAVDRLSFVRASSEFQFHSNFSQVLLYNERTRLTYRKPFTTYQTHEYPIIRTSTLDITARLVSFVVWFRIARSWTNVYIEWNVINVMRSHAVRIFQLQILIKTVK